MAKRRPKPKSEYGRQLDEKQELKAAYALGERQFRRYFARGANPEKIFKMLELRVDNIAYRSGFAPTIGAARQAVTHGHVMVNGRRIDIPSYPLKVNDVLAIRDSASKKGGFRDLAMLLKKYEAPKWIAVDRDKLSAKVIAEPTGDDPLILNRIKPVIEFYSR